MGLRIGGHVDLHLSTTDGDDVVATLYNEQYARRVRHTVAMTDDEGKASVVGVE